MDYVILRCLETHEHIGMFGDFTQAGTYMYVLCMYRVKPVHSCFLYNTEAENLGGQGGLEPPHFLIREG